MTPGFLTCRIARVENWCKGLRSIWLDTSLPFAAGQFFQLALTQDGRSDKRSYSAASAPGAPLEFLISEVAGGVLSPRLCSLHAGDEVDVDPTALGFFTLDEVPDCETLWLISTGTGLGPTLSMLREGTPFDRFRRVCVVHGVRTSEHLAHSGDLRQLVQTRGLIYVPAVSQGAAPPGGVAGRVTRVYEDGSLEATAGVALDSHSHVLLCGNPAMIDEMSGLFRARGLKKHRRRDPGHFNFEKYW